MRGRIEQRETQGRNLKERIRHHHKRQALKKSRSLNVWGEKTPHETIRETKIGIGAGNRRDFSFWETSNFSFLVSIFSQLNTPRPTGCFSHPAKSLPPHFVAPPTQRPKSIQTWALESTDLRRIHGSFQKAVTPVPWWRDDFPASRLRCH